MFVILIYFYFYIVLLLQGPRNNLLSSEAVDFSIFFLGASSQSELSAWTSQSGLSSWT